MQQLEAVTVHLAPGLEQRLGRIPVLAGKRVEPFEIVAGDGGISVVFGVILNMPVKERYS